MEKMWEKERKHGSGNNGDGKGKGGFRRKLTGAIAVLLAGAMAAGCGQPKGPTTAQKEFVYMPEYVKLDFQDDIDRVKALGDTIYFVSGKWDDATSTYQKYLGKIKIGETMPEKVPLEMGDGEYIMTSDMDKSGDLLAIVVKDLYEEGPGEGNAGETGTDENAGAEAVPDVEDGKADETGEIGKTESEKNGNAGAEDGSAESVEDGTETSEEGSSDGTEEEDASKSVSILSSSSVTVTSGGGSTASASISLGSGGVEYPQYVGQTMELRRIGADGKTKEAVSLDSVLNNPDMYIQYMLCDNEGNIYIGYEQNILVLDKDGKELFNLELDNWLNNMFVTGDGQVLVAYWGGDGVEVHMIDREGKKIGDKVDALSEMRYGSFRFAEGMDTDLLFSVEGKLYSYNFGDEKAQFLLSWIDCDIDESYISGFTMLEDGRVLVITNSWDGESGENRVELAYLTKKKGSEAPEKKILTYGTLMLDYDIRKRILEFNRMNQEYRIEVNEYYTDYGEEDAYSNAVQRMNSDIVSGKCPDIIDVSNGNMQSYIAKGVVADLYPFMDKDEEINREDYLESILGAYEKGGKLYAMPSDFFISTVMAKTADVGEGYSISLDKVMELAKGLPEGTELYQYASKSSVLSSILRMNMDVFVDWNTGECKFNGEEFIKVLEFANTFPKEFNWEEDRPSVPTRIREGKLIMMDVGISSMQEYQMYKGMYGEPVTLIGYPTSKESGSAIISNGSLPAMSAKSPYQDGVWQFIRAGLTKEAQEGGANRHRYGFPVMKSALEKQFAEDMEEEYWDGPDGEKQKQPKTTWGYDDFQIEIYAATEEEVDAVWQLIDHINTSWQFDTQMFQIIEEESGAFFEGQKSAKDVADIIQSRVQIYVNENR